MDWTGGAVINTAGKLELYICMYRFAVQKLHSCLLLGRGSDTGKMNVGKKYIHGLEALLYQEINVFFSGCLSFVHIFVFGDKTVLQ